MSRLSLRVVAAFVGCYVFCYLTFDVMPLTIENLTASRGFTVSEAGSVATCLTLSIAVSSALFVRVAARGHRGRLARVTLTAGALGFTAAAFSPQTPLIVGGLILGGLGVGATIAVSTAAIAATADPDGTTTVVTFINRGAAGVLVIVLPLIGNDFAVVMCALAVLLVVAIPLAGGLPDAVTADTTGTAIVPERPPRGYLLPALLIGLGFFVWCLSEDMVYTITATVAIDSAGVPDNQVGLVLSLSMVGGVLGTLAAPLFQRVVGRSWSLAITIAVGGASKFVLITATSVVPFSIAMFAWGFAYAMTLIYIVGLSASVDRSGRTASIATTFYLCGFPLSPLVGGYLADNVGIVGFALAAAIPSAAVALLFPIVISLFRLRERASAPARPSSPTTRETV